ncbi:hypothetical protein F4801DRAFT_187812 [Xylaria longipes]|nr:hypothetical protein F4801DRAFT_187812 [Xylaria longipes]
MRTFLLPTPLLFVLLLQTGSLLAIDNDFSAYPEGSQSCLYESADQAGCTSADSGAELNQCLCKNRSNFVYNAASCVAKKSPSDLDATYETLSSNCAGTGVTLSVSKQAFLAAAAAATQTTSTPTSTSTPTNTDSSASPTSTNPDQTSSDSGLSTGTKIGIGVGVGFGVIAAALAAWFIWAYQRKRHFTQSAHSNEISGGGAGSASGGVGGFGITNQPHHEYAQDNTQQAPAELAPVAWTPHAGFAAPGYTAGEVKKDGMAGMPLLAELGNQRQTAVELPASPGFLGYSDRVPEQNLNPGHRNGPVTPDGVSPATYRSDLSPFTPSRSSETGTYR